MEIKRLVCCESSRALSNFGSSRTYCSQREYLFPEAVKRLKERAMTRMLMDNEYEGVIRLKESLASKLLRVCCLA